MVVKDNQPQLREDIATVFALPPIVGETPDGGGDGGRWSRPHRAPTAAHQ